MFVFFIAAGGVRADDLDSLDEGECRLSSFLISFSFFGWRKKISFCGFSPFFFLNVNIVGNPESSCSCGNDWTSWLATRDNATKPMRNSQSSIQYPSEFIRRCQTLPVCYWKVKGRHLKIPLYTVASRIFSWPILGVLNGSLNVIELRLLWVERENY